MVIKPPPRAVRRAASPPSLCSSVKADGVSARRLRNPQPSALLGDDASLSGAEMFDKNLSVLRRVFIERKKIAGGRNQLCFETLPFFILFLSVVRWGWGRWFPGVRRKCFSKAFLEVGGIVVQ